MLSQGEEKQSQAVFPDFRDKSYYGIPCNVCYSNDQLWSDLGTHKRKYYESGDQRSHLRRYFFAADNYGRRNDVYCALDTVFPPDWPMAESSERFNGNIHISDVLGHLRPFGFKLR